MKRTITMSMTLALVLMSNFSAFASATNVNSGEEQIQSLTIVNNGEDNCKGDKTDPCEPSRVNR